LGRNNKWGYGHEKKMKGGRAFECWGRRNYRGMRGGDGKRGGEVRHQEDRRRYRTKEKSQVLKGRVGLARTVTT